MISHVTEQFRRLYTNLPEDIRKRAREAYRRFTQDPYYPGLHFKRIHSTRPIYAVRISRDYRALGIQKENEIVWFWIGSHSEYDKVLTQLRRT